MIKTIINFFYSNLLWSHGRAIVLILVLIAGIAFVFFRPLFYLAVAFFMFSLFFFRNPQRRCPEAETDDRVLICPADGRVVEIKKNSAGYRVSIFLSPFDVHVNWIAVTGVVHEITYKPGRFAVAFAPKSSDINERNDIVIVTDDGFKMKVRQIAGFIARRIVCWLKQGQSVHAGQKYGMIRFGSRVDVFLPTSVDLKVTVGQRVYGGQTVLGRRT